MFSVPEKEEEEVPSTSKDSEESSAGGAAGTSSTKDIVEGALASGLAKGKDTVEAIRFYLAEKLGFYDDAETDDDTDHKDKVKLLRTYKNMLIAIFAHCI